MRVSVMSFMVLLGCVLQVLVSFFSGRMLAFEEVPECFRCLATYGAYMVAGWSGCMFGGT